MLAQDSLLITGCYDGNGTNLTAPLVRLRIFRWGVHQPYTDAVPKDDRAAPKSYALHQNYPNPFNPTTEIKFDLPEASSVRLSVFNILGQEVATLVNGAMDAGYQSLEWNSANHEGVALPSGIYIYRLQATSMTSGKEFHEVMKMVLMK